MVLLLAVVGEAGICLNPLCLSKSNTVQGYTVRRMVETADDFYTSMGLHPVPDGFYNKSRFTRPEDGRSVSCHPMAWEFYDKTDFRWGQTICALTITVRLKD